jgi:hypothetical protein
MLQSSVLEIILIPGIQVVARITALAEIAAGEETVFDSEVDNPADRAGIGPDARESRY